MEDNIKQLAETNFIVCGIVTENHSTNVSTFCNILSKYGNSKFSILHPNNHSKCTYLFFDTVYLVKNIRHNLLNSKKFVFPKFEFCDCVIQCPYGYIVLGDILRTYDFDTNLQSHLKKAPKLSNQVLHLGNNKPNVLLALSIFK